MSDYIYGRVNLLPKRVSVATKTIYCRAAVCRTEWSVLVDGSKAKKLNNKEETKHRDWRRQVKTCPIEVDSRTLPCSGNVNIQLTFRSSGTL